MELLKKITTVTLGMTLIVALGACGKKKNGSTNASPPAPASTQCVMNAQGQLVYPNGQPCTTGQILCPSTGVFTNSQGQQQQCVPGQMVTNGAYNYQYPGQYPHTPYPVTQTQSCAQYYYQYGVEYVPVMLQNQYVCVRIDLLQPYTYNTAYEDYGYDYYYAYPPYSGSGCSTSIDFGGSWGSVGICF